MHGHLTRTSIPDHLARALSGTSATLDERGEWLEVRHPAGPAVPAQGWKLHVSAHPATALDVLDAVTPVLLRHLVTFKVARSEQTLMAINSGAGGASQIGKFLTVYPPDDETARVLAEELHERTRDLAGPRIPSDRPLRTGSVVHYRYGSFGGDTVMVLPDGTLAQALTSPTGVVEADRREPFFTPPAWAVDPFQTGRPDEPSDVLAPQALSGSRYRAVAVLSDTGRGSTFLGVDTAGPRRCILKAADLGGTTGPVSSHAALRREAAVLEALPPNPAWPRFYDVVDTDEQVFLVMEDVDATPFSDHVATTMLRSGVLSSGSVVALGTQVASAVAALHAQGIVHRDLKSENVLVRDDGSVCLVDLEHAASVGAPARPGGTRGYMSARQQTGQVADPAEDVHALGALLFLAATGCEPSRSPRGDDLLTRPLELLNPKIDADLAALVRACLDPAPPTPTLQEVRAALGEIGRRSPHGHTRSSVAPAPTAAEVEALSDDGLLASALGLADSLCEVALPVGARPVTWASTAPGMLPVPHRQVNNGVPGVLLGLAHAWTVGGRERHRDTLLRGARWLAESPELPGARISGLYAGEAGVGAALLVAGLAAEDPDALEAAYACERRLRAYPFEDVDLYHGTAGRLRFLTMLLRHGADSEVRAHADACADHLHRTAAVSPDGLAHWPGSVQTESQPVPGYAHGTAGIADALLDLCDLDGDPAHRRLAEHAARWVLGQSVPSRPDDPDESDGALDWGHSGTFGGLWCYGASGVGLLFLRLGDLATAGRAGRCVELEGRYAGPGLCHGLGGSIEYLLDLHHRTGEARWLTSAVELQRLLHAFRERRPDGLAYPANADTPRDVSYMLGDAGTIGTLLRQRDQGRTPRMLTPAYVAGFTEGPRAAPSRYARHSST